MKPNRTPPPYVAKAQQTALLAHQTPGGIDIHFSSRSEATQNRMRFYQARQALLRQNPEDMSPLATVETKIIDCPKGAILHMEAAGSTMFDGQIIASRTGEVLDTSAIRQARVPQVDYTARDTRITEENAILEEMWEDPLWKDASPEAREAELKRRREEELFREP